MSKKRNGCLFIIILLMALGYALLFNVSKKLQKVGNELMMEGNYLQNEGARYMQEGETMLNRARTRSY